MARLFCHLGEQGVFYRFINYASRPCNSIHKPIFRAFIDTSAPYRRSTCTPASNPISMAVCNGVSPLTLYEFTAAPRPGQLSSSNCSKLSRRRMTAQCKEDLPCASMSDTRAPWLSRVRATSSYPPCTASIRGVVRSPSFSLQFEVCWISILTILSWPLWAAMCKGLSHSDVGSRSVSSVPA
ncbi:hypothetical protein LZ30DRAFT_36486 [Colletotrichum cereale]|nr:hypothetical protein LZ30DRAFT_36486 [Colletotrichum cereale]